MNGLQRRGSQWGAALVVCLLTGPALADESAKRPPDGVAAEKKAEPRKRAKPLSLYVPPSRGRAHTRSSGGTRAPMDLPKLELVAPEHEGLTTRPDPTLYFYVSTATEAQIEFTLIEDEAEEPLVETTLSTSGAPGFQSVSLADLGVQLEPATHYMWFVSLVPDPDGRSGDLVAGAGIQRVETSDALAGALAGGGADYAAYAAHGIWYDAMGDLSGAVARDPDDAALRAQRAALLEQVDLPESAAFAAQ